MKPIKEATLTDLRRKTTELVRPVIAGQGKLVITEHGEPVLEIAPAPKLDRKKALEALRRIGPLEFLPRK